MPEAEADGRTVAYPMPGTASSMLAHRIYITSKNRHRSMMCSRGTPRRVLQIQLEEVVRASKCAILQSAVCLTEPVAVLARTAHLVLITVAHVVVSQMVFVEDQVVRAEVEVQVDQAAVEAPAVAVDQVDAQGMALPAPVALPAVAAIARVIFVARQI